MLSPVIILAIVIVVIILLYFMLHSTSAAGTTGTTPPPSTLPSAVGKTIDLSSMKLMNPYYNLNPAQVYTYNGKGVFTGNTVNTLFAYTFQPPGSSNIFVLIDFYDSTIVPAYQLKASPTSFGLTNGSWTGAGLVDITSFASKYSDVTPIPVNANTLLLMPASYTGWIQVLK